jgi:small-conductance mechanosensitive channel
MPSPEPLHNPGDRSANAELTFEQELAAAEQALQDLKARYTQVQQDQAQQAQLQQRRDRLQQALEQSAGADLRTALKVELKQVQAQLDELEINLESQLFSWTSLKEPFWQVMRFGGLGVAIGWFLAFLVINAPQPAPPTPAPTPPSNQR